MDSKDIYISGDISQAIEEEVKKNDRKYDYFHPSQFADCSRKILYYYYYDLKNQRDIFLNTGADLQKKFDNGHYMHDRYTNYLRKTGNLRGWWRCSVCHVYDKDIVLGKEDPLGIKDPNLLGIKCPECGGSKFKYTELSVYNEEYKFKGHVDALYEKNGTIYVVDFKTIKLKKFWDLKEPSIGYYVQLNIYLWLLNLDYGKLLYECKDDQNNKEFLINKSEDMINEIKKKSLLLQSLQKEGKLTKRPYSDKNNFECTYCPFKDVCWGGIKSVLMDSVKDYNNYGK